MYMYVKFLINKRKRGRGRGEEEMDGQKTDRENMAKKTSSVPVPYEYMCIMSTVECIGTW